MEEEEEQQQQGVKFELIAYDMKTLMEKALEGLLAPGIKARFSDELPRQVLSLVGGSYDGIPCIAAEEVIFVKLPPSLGKLKKVLDESGIKDEEEAKDIRAKLSALIEQNALFNARRGPPKFYPMAFIPRKTKIATVYTPMDDVVRGRIYSIATLVVTNQPAYMQHAYYKQLVAILVSRAIDPEQCYPMRLDSEVNYGYYISNGNKLNLFLSVVD